MTFFRAGRAGRTRSRRRATLLTALAAVGVVGLAGCQVRSTPAGPSTFTVKQLHLKFRAPAELAGLTYEIGRSGEGKPAANFSTKAVTQAGGPTCAAAVSGVGAYPVGQLVLSPETPEEVAAEKKRNPEDPLGDFVKKVGTHYVYYSAPPQQSCADDRLVGTLQRRATQALKAAVRTVEVAS